MLQSFPLLFQTSMRSQHKLTALMVLCCALGPAFTASITKREAPLPGGSYLPPSSGGGAGGYPAAGPPSGSYGPPSSGGGAGGYPSGAGGAPSQQYGAPSQGGSFGGQSPSQQYGAPSAPSQQYGAPSSGSGFGGRPQAPSQQYGAPSHGNGNGHGSSGHGASRYDIKVSKILWLTNNLEFSSHTAHLSSTEHHPSNMVPQAMDTVLTVVLGEIVVS